MTGDALTGFNVKTGDRLKSPGITNPLESLECCAAFQCRDMSTDRRDAWSWCIMFGIDDDENEQELRKKHGWTDSDISRLKLLHDKWTKLKEICENELN